MLKLLGNIIVHSIEQVANKVAGKIVLGYTIFTK